ncbi:MAG TPA: hypothetical protein VF115_11235 [Acidimicrobiia bacterium]
MSPGKTPVTWLAGVFLVFRDRDGRPSWVYDGASEATAVSEIAALPYFPLEGWSVIR